MHRFVPFAVAAFVLCCASVVLPREAAAGTYWVSPTGKAAWTACAGETPLNGTAACSVATANVNAVAGDTIYLRGGTYLQTSSECAVQFGCGIEPRNRGTSAARITYAAYPNETPVFTSEPGLTTSRGIWIHNGAPGVGTYIRVTGITFRNLYKWAHLHNYASYNELDRNTFSSDTGEDFGDVAGLRIDSLCAGGASWSCYSQHNWIHHNSFSKVHHEAPAPCHEGADMIRIGIAYSASRDNANSATQDDYNTVEYNTVAYAGHALMDSYGGYNVIRGNFFHNEAWIADTSGGNCSFPTMPNGKYGHRGLQTSEDYARPRQSVLVEGNRFGFSSANPNNPGDASYAIASSATIVRYNDAYGAHQSGIGTKWYNAYPNAADALAHRGGGGTGPYNIRIYNNTAFWNGQTYPYMQSLQAGCTTCPGKLAGINVFSGAQAVIVKNNIAFNNYSHTVYGLDITVDSGKNPSLYPRSITEDNNWKTPNGDPLFANPNVSDPTSPTLPDLSLRATSGAIDKAAPLARANGAGSGSTRLVVDDAMYFQDGTWGSALARGVSFFPDWIAVGTVANVVKITAIDYATNTIFLAAPVNWADGAPIWLYKRSDGSQVLFGAAPDLGAREFRAAVASPGAPRVTR